MTSTVEVPDPDVLVSDDPEKMQPDHDESLAPWVVPDLDEQHLVGIGAQLPFDSAKSVQAGSAPNVRFSREIRQGMSGKDVLGHKRALSRARPDLYEWGQFTDFAGEFFLDAVVKYKRAHSLGTSRVLGGVAHESLERQHRKGHSDEWAFDALAIELCQQYYDATHTSPDERIRNGIVQAGFFWFGQKFNIAYSQYRPFELGKPPFVPHRWDCSAFVTNCHYAGGAPNPNGRPWDHLGYTGTLMSRGTRVGSVAQLLPGDLIFYGFSTQNNEAFSPGDPTHVALYTGTVNGTHMVLSMGSYPMSYTAYNYRHDINHYRHYSVA